MTTFLAILILLTIPTIGATLLQMIQTLPRVREDGSMHLLILVVTVAVTAAIFIWLHVHLVGIRPVVVTEDVSGLCAFVGAFIGTSIGSHLALKIERKRASSSSS